MRQRVALARALAQDADVLLMDEPFGALDAITRDLLHDELERVWQETGVTIVFVTHNVREAVRLGDRVLLLSSRPGRIADRVRDRVRPSAPCRVARGGRVVVHDRRPVARGGETACDPSSPTIDRRKSAGQRGARRRDPRDRRARDPDRGASVAVDAALARDVAGGRRRRRFFFLWQVVVWLKLRPDYALPGPASVFDRPRREDRER